MTEATGGEHVSGTAAALARAVDVDPRTLRRLLGLLDRAGLLVRTRGGWQVPDPKQLEGVEGGTGGTGFERDPRGAFRVAADRLAAGLSAGGRRGGGLSALTALGAYELLRLRHAPWHGNGRPRPVTVGGRRRPAPSVQVAAVLHLHRETWSLYAVALVDAGLLERVRQGHAVVSLLGLHAVTVDDVCAAGEAVQVHPTETDATADVHRTDSPSSPDIHRTDRSRLTRKTLPEDPSLEDPARTGPAEHAGSPGRPARLLRAGRHGDPAQDADNTHHDEITSSHDEGAGEHPDLAATITEIIRLQPAFTAVGRPGHPARSVLDRALRDGVTGYVLTGLAVNGGYTRGCRWPAAVLAAKLPRAVAHVLADNRRRAAQTRHGVGRPVAVALDLNRVVADEWPVRVSGCPAWQAGQVAQLRVPWAQTCRCQHPAAATDSADPSDRSWFLPGQPMPVLYCRGTSDCATCWQCSGGLPDRPGGYLCPRCRYGRLPRRSHEPGTRSGHPTGSYFGGQSAYLTLCS